MDDVEDIILQGKLETRGAEIVGKWKLQYCQLLHGSIRFYDCTDDGMQSGPVVLGVPIGDVTGLTQTIQKREACIDLANANTKVRLRFATVADANTWFSALSAVISGKNDGRAPSRGLDENRQMWLQFDKITGLPMENAFYTLHVCLQHRQTNGNPTLETEPRQASLRTAVAYCDIRQQLTLDLSRSDDTKVVVTARKRATTTSTDRIVIGSFTLDVNDISNRKPNMYELANPTGEPTGAQVRIKIKPVSVDQDAPGRTELGPMHQPQLRGQQPRQQGHDSSRILPNRAQDNKSGVNERACSPGEVGNVPASTIDAAERLSTARTPRGVKPRRKAESPCKISCKATLDGFNRHLDSRRERVKNTLNDCCAEIFPNELEKRLSPDEIKQIFAKVGYLIPWRDCEMLVRSLSETGDGLVGVSDITNAALARRRGLPIKWHVSAQEGMEAGDVERECRQRPDNLFEYDTEHIMEWIANYLDTERMRLQDMFVHLHVYVDVGNPLEINASTLGGALARAGLDLSTVESRSFIDTVDVQGRGRIEILDLEHMLRSYRRGYNLWECHDFLDRQSEAHKCKQSLKRSYGEQISFSDNMHAEHQARSERIEAERSRRETEAENELREAIEENRCGTRADVDRSKPRHAEDRCHQLYHNHKEILERREELQRQALEECIWRPAQVTTEENLNWPDRLYQDALTQRQRKAEDARNKEDDEIRLARQLANPPNNNIAPRERASECFGRLYDEAKARCERRRERVLDLIVEQQKEKLKTPRSKKRSGNRDDCWTDLHADHAKRIANTKLKQDIFLRQEELNNKLTAVAARSKSCPASGNVQLPSYDHVQAKIWTHSVFRKKPCIRGESPPRTPRSQVPKGFGCSTPRADALEDDDAPERSSKRTVLTQAEHAILTVVSAVYSRICFDGPHPPRDAMAEMAALCEATIKEFKECAIFGSTELYHLQSMRIYSDSNLLADDAAFAHGCKPCPIMQPNIDFDTLLVQARAAHLELLRLVGPREMHADVWTDGSWPSRSRWKNPRVCPSALYAYNPGPKKRSSAWVKAFVRYGPTVGLERHRHLLDLARISLVFADSAMLKAGLKNLCEEFDVVLVSNYYVPRRGNLIGDKYIVCYLILNQNLDTPHICEIRLDELSYFLGRKTAERNMEQIGNVLRNYIPYTAEPGTVLYYIKWILTRPKLSRTTTQFKNLLAREFGSLVVAWRTAFGNNQLLDFGTFKKVCAQLSSNLQCVKIWNDLDCGFGGCISVFDLDPDCIVLLAKFYALLAGVMPVEVEPTPEAFFEKLLKFTKPRNNCVGGTIELPSFKHAAKVLGFNTTQSGKLFSGLDGRGGRTLKPPSTVCLKDIAWMRNLPDLCDLDTATLQAMTPAGLAYERGQQAASNSRTGVVRQSSFSSSFLSRVASESSSNWYREFVTAVTLCSNRGLSSETSFAQPTTPQETTVGIISPSSLPTDTKKLHPVEILVEPVAPRSAEDNSSALTGSMPSSASTAFQWGNDEDEDGDDEDEHEFFEDDRGNTCYASDLEVSGESGLY